VILLNTPGGDSTSMNNIIQAELHSKVPVIVYVSPEGARAASAGAYITMAADVAAMAPTTHIGAATPIQANGQNVGSDSPARSSTTLSPRSSAWPRHTAGTPAWHG